MAVTLTSLSDLAGYGFDDIIDVRAPAEDAEDHLPGAINLPVLDGGHLLYHVAEWIRGRPLPDRVYEIGQRLGMAFIMTVMLLALFNDFGRLFAG